MDAKLLNDKLVMTRTLAVEWRVITDSLNTVPAIYTLFTRHELEWMAISEGPYNEEMVREFYISYVAAL